MSPKKELNDFPRPVPRYGLILAFFLPLLAYIPTFIWGWSALPVFLLDLAVLLACLVDYLLALGQKPPRAEFFRHYALAVGKDSALSFALVESQGRRQSVIVKLDLPDEWPAERDMLRLKLLPRQRLDVNLRLKCSRRGRREFSLYHLRQASPLGLMWVQREQKASFTLEVLPDFSGLQSRLRLAQTRGGLREGSHLDLRRGGAAELDYLRDYRHDDDYRRIDWKASCRLGRPIVKVMRSESSRPIVFLLDAGRLMLAEQDGVSSLDRAIGALLVVARIALELGDSVSVIVFQDRVVGELPNLRGRSGLRDLSAFLSRFEAAFVESNYSAAFDYLSQRLGKRSLIVLLSDMMDDFNFDLFRRTFSVLARRHYPLMVMLRDKVIGDWAEEPIAPNEDASLEYARASARHMFLCRERALTRLRAHGLAALDLLPSELNAGLTEKYLELKRRGQV